MADYSLHCFLESGNAYKPALMLTLCDADWDAVWVDFFKGANRTDEFRALNEFGEVPVLVDHTKGDIAISQSGVILYHLAEAFGQFGPETDEEKREILRWILFDNHKLTGNLATYRFLRKFMGKGDTPEALFTQGRMMQAIKSLERRLSDREWIAAERPTIADISIIGYLTWPDHIGLSWDDFPNIKAWLSRMESLPNFAPPEEILPTS